MAISNPRSAITTLLVLSLAVVGAVGFLAWRQRVPGVEASYSTAPESLGAHARFDVELRTHAGGLAWAELKLVQGSNAHSLVRRDFPLPRTDSAQLSLELSAQGLGLEEGSARLELFAADDYWRPRDAHAQALLSLALMLDFTPPQLECLGLTRYPAQGGAGIAILRGREAHRLGVAVGEDIFWATPAGPAGSGIAVVLYALPFDHAQDAPIQGLAVDRAGNEARMELPVLVSPRSFKSGAVDLDAGFLAAKLPELLPERAPLAREDYADAFVTVSRDLRARAAERKRECALQSATRPLWEGAFVQPRNTRVFSNYAETRSYRFEGKSLDTQVHEGFDLASVKRAPVPAANTGVVVHAGPLYIYGNVVILDHGLGLQSLYAHLSSVEVELGQRIARGEIVGRTGTSGLAVGDHLHYEMLVHGTPVNPLQWWDARWVDEHIAAPLRDAGIQFTEASE